MTELVDVVRVVRRRRFNVQVVVYVSHVIRLYVVQIWGVGVPTVGTVILLQAAADGKTVDGETLAFPLLNQHPARRTYELMIGRF